jgi:hypothetical protein
LEPRKQSEKLPAEKAFERREKKTGNCEVTPQATRLIVKFIIKRDEPSAPTAIHGPSGLKYQPLKKATTTADGSESQFTPHDVCVENHKRWVEARVQALLEAADDTLLEKLRPCDMQKLIHSLKLRKACGIDGIPNEHLRHLPRRPLVYFIYLFNHCLRFSHFRKSWEDAKITTLPKRGKDPKFLQYSCPISLLATTGKLFEKK